MISFHWFEVSLVCCSRRSIMGRSSARQPTAPDRPSSPVPQGGFPRAPVSAAALGGHDFSLRQARRFCYALKPALFGRLGRRQLHRIWPVAVAERLGVDLFELDLACQPLPL